MGLGDRIRNWFSPPKPLSSEIKEGDYFQKYSSLRDLKKRQQTRQRRTRPRTTSMPPELETWATKLRSASQIEHDRLLFISPARDFTERAVDCEGLEEKNAKKTAARVRPPAIPVSSGEDNAGLLTAWDRKFLRGGGKKNKKKGPTRPASTSELSALGVRSTAPRDSRHLVRHSQSIADLDRIGMDTIRSVPPSIDQYDSKLKFREAFAKGLWSIEPLKIGGSGRSNKPPSQPPPQPPIANAKQSKSRSIGDDRDIRLFNSYFKTAHQNNRNNSPPSSESGVATDDDFRESPKSVRFNKRQPLVLPEIANEYMIVIDAISSNRNRNDSYNEGVNDFSNSEDVNDFAPIVSPLPSIVSFEEELDRITSRLPTSSVLVGEQCLSELKTFAADVVLDMNATTCEVLYRLNRPATSALDHSAPTHVVQESESSMSCLLLYPDGRFHSFGQVARQFYCDLEPPEAQTFMFFDKISASLFDRSNLTIDSQTRARNGASHRTIDVLIECFRHFKLRSTKKLSDLNNCNPIESQAVRWTIVLTSTTSPAAVQLVREAAEKACLVSPRVSDQLCFISASDALAIGCLEQSMNLKIPRLNIDDSFVVVNAGVDCTEIAAYKVKRDGFSLEQLIVPKNEQFGMCAIEDEFEKLLVDVFSKDFIKDLKRKYPGAWLELLSAFEAKRSTSQLLSESPLTVAVPLIFAETLKKKRGLKPQAAIKKYNSPDVCWNEQGMLKLQPSLLKKMQEIAIGTVTNAIGQAISEVTQPAYLFLDGPWSRSALLTDHISRTFSSTVKVIVLPSLSTLSHQAAVLRDRPQLINPRLSPLTFGVSVLNPFDPALHPPSKRLSKHGNQWCNDVFDRLVIRGCAVQKAVRRYCPASPSQKEMAISVYCSETPSPQYTTDENVHKCGSVRLDLMALQSVAGLREVEVTLDFTRADVMIAAKDISSGKMLTAHLDFLRHSR